MPPKEIRAEVNKTIRILLVEDNPDDAELLQVQLQKLGLKASFRRVESADALKSALDQAECDLILSDYRLPGFSGTDALRIYRESGLQVPFLLVSGSIGEEAAVECLKSGAHDYIMKDNLKRLVPAIRRALQDFAEKAAHQASVRRYQQIVEQSQEGLWIVGASGRIIMCNSRLAQILGCSSQEMKDYPLLDLLDPEDQARLLAFPAEPMVAAMRRPGGEARTPLWASLTATPIVDDLTGEDAILGRLSDVTRAKQLEQQYLKAQKTDALGRLASGVAHDFNNLLSVVIGFTEIIMRDTSPNGAILESFSEVLRAARQGALLTHQLLVVGRRQAPGVQTLSINSAVQELRQMLTRLLGPNVSLHLNLGASPDTILLEPTAFTQVILNLVINARDAMDCGGQIHLETSNDDEGRVLLSICDQGVGIDPAVIESIFDPFFTTKEADKGTGLGLSTVLSIVEQSQGTIQVQSNPGQGTTFILSWPPGNGACRPTPKSGSVAVSTKRGSILVAEDSDAVRQVFVSMLERQGYVVLQAADGLEALDRAEQYEGTLDLLLADVIMPGIDGLELASRLRQRQPDLRVILTSGFGSPYDDMGETGQEFLEKPVEADYLIERVQLAMGPALAI